MSCFIEDYALLGDTKTAALVSNKGSIDWLCLPRFDSGACFAALLGDRHNGRFSIAPGRGAAAQVRRWYRDTTLVLETEFTTQSGVVRVIDCMPPERDCPYVVRLVQGIRGHVPMRLELIIRFDYGWVVPWVRKIGGALHAVGGPDALVLYTNVPTHGENLTTVADFTVSAGQRIPFVLSWHASHEPPPPAIDAEAAIEATERYWLNWLGHCAYRGEFSEAVNRSLVVLKALTYAPTGGIVAAPTTSLPESVGGVRNWDYRFCWIRDATFTLVALMLSGFVEEARAFRDWLLRAVAGTPSQMHIMYGLAGERRLPELTLPWLTGYEGSRPVRVGNAAVDQLQLDVYGEIMDALHLARRSGTTDPDPSAWRVQTLLLEFLETNFREPDQGIWEVRGPRRHFTHSKVMAWVAFDRAIKAVERFGAHGPVARWRSVRDALHEEVCTRGYDPKRGCFVQSYGSRELDASLLLIPLVGFLPASDRRVLGTVAAIERELVQGGLVLRYRTRGVDDGLPPGEGAFLACSFWLADNYALIGKTSAARALFRHLLTLRNDVGLLAEQYDPVANRLLGNFPQAFSHVGLINTAFNLTPRQPAPARERAAESELHWRAGGGAAF